MISDVSRDYQILTISGPGRDDYGREKKRPEKPLKLHQTTGQTVHQTAGQTTCNEYTRRDRKHSSPSPATGHVTSATGHVTSAAGHVSPSTYSPTSPVNG